MSDKLSIVTKRNNSTIVTLDSDVILVVGARIKRLKAYSLVIKSASKVFRAILSTRFSEG